MDDMPQFEDLRQQRHSIDDAIESLNQSVAFPTGSGAAWVKRVQDALDDMVEAFEEHCVTTESEGGLFDEVTDEAPRLVPRVEVLKSEHRTFRVEIKGLQALAEDMETLDLPEQADAVRERVVSLVRDMARHRHRGVDLVYDAFGLDIGEI